MPFDVQVAKKDGVTDAQIADYLAQKSGFDIGKARNDNVPDSDIVTYLSQKVAAPKTSAPEQNIIEKIGSSPLANELAKNGSEMADIIKNVPNQNPASSALQIIGQGAKTAATPIAMGISAITPESVKNYVSDSAVGDVARQYGQKWSEFSKQNPEISKDIGAATNIATMLPAGKVATAATDLATEGAGKVLSASGNVAKNAADIGAEKFAAMKAAKLAENPVPMTYSALKENSNNLYKQADALGGGFSPKLGEDITKAAQSMKDTGFKGELRPEAKTFNKKLDYYSKANNSDMTLADFQKMDKDLTADISAYNRSGESAYAKDLNDLKYKIRDMVKNPDYVVGTPAGVDAALAATQEWHRSLKMKDLEKIQERAAMAPNPKTSIQTQVKNLLLNENKMRGWAPEEKAALQSAQKTGALPGITNLFASRLIDSTIGGIAGMSGGPGGAIVGGLAGNALGSGAAKLAGKMQAARLGKAGSEIMKSRGGYTPSLLPNEITNLASKKAFQDAKLAARQSTKQTQIDAAGLGIKPSAKSIKSLSKNDAIDISEKLGMNKEEVMRKAKLAAQKKAAALGTDYKKGSKP